MGVVVIPESYMGQTLQETEVKRVLLDLNRDFHFDMGGNLNIWHPYQQSRQGVFHLGRHLCSMDRGTLSELQIWSMKEEQVSVPTHHLRWADIVDPFTLEEFVEMSDGKQIKTGKSIVKRKVRDKIILVGWRHTLTRIVSKNIPGVTSSELGARLRIDLTWKEEVGSNETEKSDFLNQSVSVA